MKNYRILIVEDEILIADMIKRYLQKKGHQVVGIAISYEEAEKLYLEKKPELVLLDIRLSGTKTGIDVAYFLSMQKEQTPFIFLTSQTDSRNLAYAKATEPAGYLVKPIHKESLYTTIEIAMHNKGLKKIKETSVQLFDGERNFRLPINDILYLEADHIYVKIYLTTGKKVVQRKTLKAMLSLLPPESFVQTHRSFAVNVNKVSHWDNEHIYIENKIIPMSRARKKVLGGLLRKGMILTM